MHARSLMALILIASTPVNAAVTDPAAVVDEPQLVNRAVAEPYTEPSFGTVVVRAGDALGAGASRLSPEYAQLQVWNADQTLMLLGGYLIFDAVSGEVLHAVNVRDGIGLRGSPEEPLHLYYAGFDEAGCSGNAPLMRYVLSYSGRSLRGEPELVHCFTEYGEFDNNAANAFYEEMAVNQDGKLMIGVVTNAGNGFDVFAYNVTDDVKHDAKSIPDLDWAAISPSGEYMLILGTGAGESPGWGGMEAFDLDMNFIAKVHTGSGHSDLIMDADGVEWLVVDNSDNTMFGEAKYIVKARIPDGVVYNASGGVDEAATLASGRSVKLLQLDWNLGTHISCRAVNAPDSCVVTTEAELYPGQPGYASWRPPMRDEIIRVYLDSTTTRPNIERLAHHRSSLSDYWTIPFATPRPDGGQIVFGSDREGNTGIDPYVIVLDPDSTFPGAGSNGASRKASGSGWPVLALLAFTVCGRRRRRPETRITARIEPDTPRDKPIT